MSTISKNEILWAKVNKNSKIPTKRNEDAGYDIYACFDKDYIIIKPYETNLIPTGIACGLNEDYYLQLEERGSTGVRGIKRSAGVIDSGYRGEIFVALTNCNIKPIFISKLSKQDLLKLHGDDECIKLYKKHMNGCIIYPYSKAICQGIVHIVPKLESKEISYEKLCEYESERGEGNLGSSAK